MGYADREVGVPVLFLWCGFMWLAEAVAEIGMTGYDSLPFI